MWPYPYLKVYQKKKNYTFKKIPCSIHVLFLKKKISFSIPRFKTTQPLDTWLAFLDWDLDASTNFYNSWVSNEFKIDKLWLSILILHFYTVHK